MWSEEIYAEGANEVIHRLAFSFLASHTIILLEDSMTSDSYVFQKQFKSFAVKPWIKFISSS